MAQLNSQLELFVNNVEDELSIAILRLRKDVRACEKNIYKIEKKIIRGMCQIHYDIALNPDGTVNLRVESVRRKLIKVLSLRKEALHHYYKAYYAYQNDLEILHQYLNLNLRVVFDSRE
jgi:hypothetical protein